MAGGVSLCAEVAPGIAVPFHQASGSYADWCYRPSVSSSPQCRGYQDIVHLQGPGEEFTVLLDSVAGFLQTDFVNVPPCLLVHALGAEDIDFHPYPFRIIVNDLDRVAPVEALAEGGPMGEMVSLFVNGTIYIGAVDNDVVLTPPT